MNHTQVDTLNSVLDGLNIKGRCVAYQSHRHLATFDVVLDPSTPIKRIESRTREIALGLHSRTTPIVRPIPLNGVVRLQVAMSDSDSLPIEGIFAGALIPPIRENLLPIFLGETDDGHKLCVDFSKHPHTLIAGTTGSGKSVLLHTIISNIAMLNAIEAREVHLHLIDPKRVEFNRYKKLDRFVKSIGYDYISALSLLEYLHDVMECRYNELAKLGLSSVEEQPKLFPSIVVIIDEVADIMVTDKKLKQFEQLVVKLAQKARSAGIYLVLATQRPSVDVLTGLIKACFPARISCKVSSKIDSQVILDSLGAESLLGRGDAILQSPVLDRVRFQVAYSEPRIVHNLYNMYQS